MIIDNKHYINAIKLHCHLLVLDGIYVTICWTSDDCDGQVDLKYTLVRRTSDIISLFRPLHSHAALSASPTSLPHSHAALSVSPHFFTTLTCCTVRHSPLLRHTHMLHCPPVPTSSPHSHAALSASPQMLFWLYLQT